MTRHHSWAHTLLGKASCWLMALPLVVLAGGSAHAAAIIIDDTSPSDTVTIGANDFEGGFFVNGALIQSGLSDFQSVTLPETGVPITFSGTWIDLGQTPTLTRTIYFLEGAPGASSDPLVSDIFTYSLSTNSFLDEGTITGSFLSDAPGGPGLGPLSSYGDISTLEIWYEVDGPFNFSAPFLGGQVISDAGVPEVKVPAPLPLAGAAMAFGYSRRLRRRMRGAQQPS